MVAAACVSQGCLQSLGANNRPHKIQTSAVKGYDELRNTLSAFSDEELERMVVVDTKVDGDCGAHACQILNYVMRGTRPSVIEVRQRLIELFSVPRGTKELTGDVLVEDVHVGCLANVSKPPPEGVAGVRRDPQLGLGDLTYGEAEPEPNHFIRHGYTDAQVRTIKKEYTTSHMIPSKARFLWDWEIKLFCRDLGVNVVILQEDFVTAARRGKTKRRKEIFETTVGYYHPQNRHYAFVLSTMEARHWELLGRRHGDDGPNATFCVVFGIDEGESMLQLLLRRVNAHRMANKNLSEADRAEITTRAWDSYKHDVYDFIDNRVVLGDPQMLSIMGENVFAKLSRQKMAQRRAPHDATRCAGSSSPGSPSSSAAGADQPAPSSKQEKPSKARKRPATANKEATEATASTTPTNPKMEKTARKRRTTTTNKADADDDDDEDLQLALALSASEAPRYRSVDRSVDAAEQQHVKLVRRLLAFVHPAGLPAG